MDNRNRIFIFGSVLTPIALYFGASMTMDYFEREGWRFFNTGKDIVSNLGSLAKAVKAKDIAGIDNFYARNYSGSPLGLNKLEQAEDKDGVRKYLFRSDNSTVARDAAVAEWKAYLDNFDSIEEVGLHVYRLEKWKGDPQAIVRFELIGTPKGAPAAGIDRAYFRMQFESSGGSLKTSQAALMEGDRIISEKPQFTNVAKEAGVDFLNRYYPAFLNQPLKFAMIRYGPAGITTADYDNDGFYDLFIPDGVESKLFRNRGDGTFEDVTRQSGLAGLDGVSVAVFADYDNDGHKDLFVSRTFKPNQLFQNNGDGTFTDVTRQSGIGEDCCTTVAAWADYDNDGFLELYDGRFLDPRKCIPTTFYARNSEPNQLYHNNGDGTFTNVTEQAGVGDKGLCLGVVWGDFNDDGYPDLYVVNDFGRKTLYRNNGDGTFTDITVKSNTLAYGAGMSASFADYDNDGRFDFYVTHIRSEHSWFAEAPTIRRYIVRSLIEGTWRTDLTLFLEIARQSGMKFLKTFQQMASGNTLLRNLGNGKF